MSVPRIDPTARVSDGARIADDVEIGPYCTVGPQVELHAGVRLLSHVNVAGLTTVGARTLIYPFVSIGTPPQSVHYRGGATRLVLGSDCTLRESVTMNTGTEDGGGVTRVGDRGLFMAYSHVGHDCQVGNDVIFANNATLGGHSVIGDHVFMGGLTATHQFIHIGPHAMIGGGSGVRRDVIPFAIAAGMFARLSGINVVGMRRRNFSSDAIRAVRAAYRALFLGKGELPQRIALAEKQFGSHDEVMQIINFMREKRARPLCQPGRRLIED